MNVYCDKFKNRENILSVNSRLFLENNKLMLLLLANQNPSLPEAYESQICLSFTKIFKIDNDNLVCDFDSFLSLFEGSDDFEQIIYWLAYSITMYQLCPNKRTETEFKISKLQYKKQSIQAILEALPHLFVAKYVKSICSGLIDALSTILKYCNQFNLFKYAYVSTIVGKEYFDDIIASCEGRINVGYPRENDGLKGIELIEKSEFIIDKMKGYLIAI